MSYNLEGTVPEEKIEELEQAVKEFFSEKYEGRC